MSTTTTETKKGGKTIVKNIYQKLMAIQTNLKAPKNLYNSSGKYNYRNAEGILEAVKPHLAEQNTILIIEDEVKIIGEETTKGVHTDGRPIEKIVPTTYIRATARFIDCETGEEISTQAYARECEHKGMSADQCTGTASSYARKYCLNALFLLDDTKDSDTDEMKNIENASKDNVKQFNRTTKPATQNKTTGGWGKQAQAQPQTQAKTTGGWGKQGRW